MLYQPGELNPYIDLRHPRVSRRDFLRALGGSVAGLSAAGLLASCGESISDPIAPGTGEIRGRITTLSGQPDPIGRIYLLYDNGLQTGRSEEVDAEARFRFQRVEPGNYQLRFHAPRLGRVPPHLPNPVRTSVEEGHIASYTFQIERGVYNENMIEIYVGDHFFQEQPAGEVNGTATVKLGTVVCWYNVGRHDHNVTTEGAWGTSGRMVSSQAFIWNADQLGFLPYECTYHLPQMRAVLRVIPS